MCPPAYMVPKDLSLNRVKYEWYRDGRDLWKQKIISYPLSKNSKYFITHKFFHKNFTPQPTLEQKNKIRNYHINLTTDHWLVKVFSQRWGDSLTSGIWVCATDRGRFFTSKNYGTGPDIGTFFQNTPWFLKYYSRSGSFFLTIWSQTAKMAVVFLKNDKSNPNFLFKKYVCLLAKGTECVPVTIIINKLYSNKLMLPVQALVSCSLMLTYSCEKG